jgi:hypothetical protein
MIPTEVNLANLKDSSALDVFEWVVYNLLKQNKKSEIEAGVCCYRGLNGLKCAAGWCISDDEWLQMVNNILPVSLNNKRWEAIIRLVGGITTAHKALIESLQLVHDLLPVDNWRVGFLILERALGLNSKVLREN